MTESSGRIAAAVPVLRVTSVARSMAWYADVLGFSPRPSGPADDPSFAILRREVVELMLQRIGTGVGGARSAKTAGGGWDVYIRVEGIQLLHDAVSAKIPQVGPIVTRVYGCREFEITDPDGHNLALGECC